MRGVSEVRGERADPPSLRFRLRHAPARRDGAARVSASWIVLGRVCGPSSAPPAGAGATVAGRYAGRLRHQHRGTEAVQARELVGDEANGRAPSALRMSLLADEPSALRWAGMNCHFQGRGGRSALEWGMRIAESGMGEAHGAEEREGGRVEKGWRAEPVGPSGSERSAPEGDRRLAKGARAAVERRDASSAEQKRRQAGRTPCASRRRYAWRKGRGDGPCSCF